MKQNILIEHVRLLESVEPGKKYKCVIIEAGITKTANTTVTHNGRSIPVKKKYLAGVLKTAFDNGLFEGVPFLIRDERDHLNFKNNYTDNVAGYFSETKWDEDLQAGVGMLNLRQGSNFTNTLKTKIKSLWESTKSIGLSIAAYGEWVIEKIENEFVATVNTISEVTSIDPCREGNAGGKIVQLVESADLNNIFNNQNNNEMINLKQKRLVFDALVSSGKIEQDKKIEEFSDDQLLTLVGAEELASILKGVTPDEQPEPNKPHPNPDPHLPKPIIDDPDSDKPLPPLPTRPTTTTTTTSAVLSPEDTLVIAEAKKFNNETKFKKIMAESKLPQQAKDVISDRYESIGYAFNEYTLKKELSSMSKILAETSLSGMFPSQSDRFSMGMEQLDKYDLAMDWLLSNPAIRSRFTAEEKKRFSEAGVTGLISFKEFYRELTGDIDVSGNVGRGGKLAETINSTTYAELLGNSMNRSVLRAYKMSAYTLDWRKIANIVPRTDFKENTVIAHGGYGNLPVVAEAAVYPAAVTPAEQAQKYSITKRGYIEEITREAIKNDSLGVIQRIPFLFGEAAARTLYEFVFNLILANPTMLYDSVALFDAAHGNTGTAALSQAALNAARIAMHAQTDITNAKKLGILARYLLIPMTLADTAYGLVTPAYGQNNQVSTFVQTWGLEPIVVAHMTDANDWYLTADPLRGDPTVEIGFLDGKEDPQILLQDEPTVGKVFTNDVITYRIRHEYDGVVENHRGFYRSVVA